MHPALIVFAVLMLAQCSFMPRDLKDFFALPLPVVERRSYELDGVTMSYVRTGNPEGTPVVFVHGSPGSWVDWKLVIDHPRLKPEFNLIAVNRPGWNEQMKPANVLPDISVQSKMLRPVLDLDPAAKKVILVGHSLGGPLILQMAVDYPEKVAALILLAPSLDPDLDAVRWYNTLADYKLIKIFLPTILSKSNDEIMALPDALKALGREMEGLHHPVILVQGEKDQLVDPGNAVYAQRHLVNARFREVLLPDFGHLIPHLRPVEVVLAIEGVVNMVDEKRASPFR